MPSIKNVLVFVYKSLKSKILSLQWEAQNAFQQALTRNRRRIKERVFKYLLEDLYKDNGASVYTYIILKTYARVISDHVGGLKDLNILEIGPGYNLGVGMLLALGGANKYYGVDVYKDPEFNDPFILRSVYAFASLIPEVITEVAATVFTDNGKEIIFNEEKVQLLCPYFSSELPIADNHLDFLFSHAAFEHFLTPEATIKEIHRVLKPGGLTAHQIDLRHHFDFSKPLEFLKQDGELWRDSFEDGNIHLFQNRWRAVDFKTKFEEAGFSVIEFNPQFVGDFQVTAEQKATFHKDFQHYSLEELSALGLFIVARKE